MELRGLQLEALVVGFVGCHDDRRARRPQQVDRFFIGRRQAGHGVDHQHDHVGLGDGQPGLVLDALFDFVARFRFQAACVDNDKAPAIPLGDVVQAVACGPGTVLDDRDAFSHEPVEKGALAHVRPAA